MSKSKPGWRIGVDVGGTFTDLVVAAVEAPLHVIKVPSVPANPAEGVLQAIRVAAEALGVSTTRLLQGCSLFVHGSTIATNTLLERKGATVGLLTTSGFRDSLETRRGMRDNPWEHRDPGPKVLVPRRLRLPVRGRMDALGNEIVALEIEDVKAAAKSFRAQDAESVAICFLHSYANAAHEKAAAELLRQTLGQRWVSVSSDISPLIGEFERTSTAVVNAYIAPRTVTYLTDLDAGLKRMGLRHSMLLVQNNGGAISVDQIAAKPVALLLSGPAAAVGALTYYGRATGSDNLISMEIGGTSCDVIVMNRGTIAVTDHFQVAGNHLALPSVEVHSVGAGGGTIAGVDGAGMLFVGPQGAGAHPGPAAYGLGGNDPTITDAQIVLGRLRPGPFANGAVTLDAQLAAKAIEKRVARPLGISVEDAAAGMLELLDQRLLHAVQRLSTERGYDTRHFTLVAAGGAGPLHAATVGRMLNCHKAYIPRLSGAYCALGMLHANVRHDLVRLHLQMLEESDPGGLLAVYRALEGEARETLTEGGFEESRTAYRYEMDLRYLGQQWDVRVAVEQIPPDKRQLRASFEKEYERLFGHHQPDGIIEITKLRVIGLGLLPPLAETASAKATGEPRPYECRRIYLGRAEGWGMADIYRGRELLPGHCRRGPLIVEEETTTLFAGPRDVVQVDASGNFTINLSSADA
jgi:N-methylhydantoinase A